MDIYGSRHLSVNKDSKSLTWRAKHSTNQAKRSNLTKRKGQISSFVDPDARFGHKSEKKTFCGYKVHADMDESDIVTLDSHGNIKKLIPLFIQEIIDGLFPFEWTAGQDVRKIKGPYLYLRILGGLDKREPSPLPCLL